MYLIINSTPKSMSLIFRFAFIAIILTGCCTSQKTAERKISRMVECNPALIKKDTVQLTIRDTIISDSVIFSHDTLLGDTTVIEKEGARVTIIRRDTILERIPIYVNVECPSDTTYLDRIIEVECPDSISVNDVDIPLTDKAVLFLFGVLIGSVLTLIILRNVRK